MASFPCAFRYFPFIFLCGVSLEAGFTVSSLYSSCQVPRAPSHQGQLRTIRLATQVMWIVTPKLQEDSLWSQILSRGLVLPLPGVRCRAGVSARLLSQDAFPSSHWGWGPMDSPSSLGVSWAASNLCPPRQHKREGGLVTAGGEGVGRGWLRFHYQHVYLGFSCQFWPLKISSTFKKLDSILL